MDFKELKEKMLATAKLYGKRFHIEMDQNFAVLKLYEEVGEFSQAVLIHKKQCRPEKCKDFDCSKEELGKELTDIIGMAVINADLLGIDLEEAILKKWCKY